MLNLEKLCSEVEKIAKKMCFSRKSTPFEYFVYFSRKEAFAESKN
jgi:hypothetical protein